MGPFNKEVEWTGEAVGPKQVYIEDKEETGRRWCLLIVAVLSNYYMHDGRDRRKAKAI